MSKIQKRLRFTAISVFLVTALLLSLVPGAAISALEVMQLTNSAAVTQLKQRIAGTADEIKLPARDVITIDDPGEGKNALEINRNLTLDLCGRTLKITTTSKDTNGLKIGGYVTIKDSVGGGKLIVTNSSTDQPSTGYGAAINITAAKLTVLSGEITATGGRNGAGIGSGRFGAAGTVVISGGTVTATGGSSGSGIGGGYGCDGGHITISGGTVKAFGGHSASGIGGGFGGDGINVTISGGTVEATGGYGGAGIGGGPHTTSENSGIAGTGRGGGVTISGGLVKATGGNRAAGIGGGGNGGGGVINISGGIVIANGGKKGSGIGGGASADENIPQLPGSLKITGGNIMPELGDDADLSSSAVSNATDGTNDLNRVNVTVTDGDDNPVDGAELTVGTYKALTYTDGKAVIWIPSPGNKEITAKKSGLPTTAKTILPHAPFKVIIRMKVAEVPNTLPKLKTGVSSTGTATVEVNTAYTRDLSTIFEDADAGDVLTYSVKIDGAAAVTAAKNYSYTPTAVGTKILIFKANDGTADSTDTFTLALTVTEAATTEATTEEVPTTTEEIPTTTEDVPATTEPATEVYVFPFTDVPSSEWYRKDVEIAHKNGLINGKTPTLYYPNDNMTVAEAVKLAACMHQFYHDGVVTLINGTGQWYSTFMEYALSKGIIETDLSGRADEKITRQEYVYIFYAALPMSEYTPINSIADNSIPDVTLSVWAKFAPRIYVFYRAGILTGSDAKGTFNPEANIKRSEVAAILTRMFDKTERKSITLSN